MAGGRSLAAAGAPLTSAEPTSEWNPNTTARAEETVSHTAKRVNESVPRTASLSLAGTRDLACGWNAHECFE